MQPNTEGPIENCNYQMEKTLAAGLPSIPHESGVDEPIWDAYCGAFGLRPDLASMLRTAVFVQALPENYWFAEYDFGIVRGLIEMVALRSLVTRMRSPDLLGLGDKRGLWIVSTVGAELVEF